jgi:integrase
LWRLGVYSGLRISDLLRLRRKDVCGSRLIVREKKSGKRKLVIFDRPVMAAIADHVRRNRLSGGDFLFYRTRLTKDAPMSRQWARAVIARTASDLGVERIGAHSMRKIYACNIFRSTGNLEAVRASLNHSKVETTMIYLKDVLQPSIGV